METIGDYLERLASNDPVPGGGSAAALTAAVAAALTAMVGRIQTPPSDAIVSRADRLRAELSEA
ncbi:MAG: cyclodeaminase/cyclohydrolase family protein, partial [Candidatus Cybelea sp.]